MLRMFRLITAAVVAGVIATATGLVLSPGNAAPAAPSAKVIKTVTWDGYGKSTFTTSLTKVAKNVGGTINSDCKSAGYQYVETKKLLNVSLDNGFTGAKTLHRITSFYGTPKAVFPKGITAGMTTKQVRSHFGKAVKSFRGDFLYAKGPKGRVVWAAFYGDKTADTVGLSYNLAEFKKHGAADGCGGA
ncbi:MAG: hypothetical protein JWQ74_1050 [Marmoricola sp.]|nr:hypothetical protein [Marmoricola sp.]